MSVQQVAARTMNLTDTTGLQADIPTGNGVDPGLQRRLRGEH